MRELTHPDLDAVCAIEAAVHPCPWQRRHFEDCLQAGYALQGLWAGAELLGYTVAMRGVDEVHLLNLSVAPTRQRQGCATLLLRALALWALVQRKPALWLEVRESNQAAVALYKGCGFRLLGVRKNYYPCPGGGREHAWVMSRALDDDWVCLPPTALAGAAQTSAPAPGVPTHTGAGA